MVHVAANPPEPNRMGLEISIMPYIALMDGMKMSEVRALLAGMVSGALKQGWVAGSLGVGYDHPLIVEWMKQEVEKTTAGLSEDIEKLVREVFRGL